MRKLEHSSGVHAERPAERPFYKKITRRLQEAARALALGTALVAGTAVAVAPVLTPSVARAQDETRDVGGRTLRVLRLDKTLAELQRETARYSSREFMPGPQNNYRYTNDIQVPNEVTFLVVLANQRNLKRLIVRFPASRETNPNVPSPGMRDMDLNDFASYVRSLSGRDMARVKFVIESGTFDYNGRETKYTNLYMFPLDANGNILTRRGNGEYVVVDCSYYADVVNSGISLLKEPNNQDSIARNP